MGIDGRSSWVDGRAQVRLDGGRSREIGVQFYVDNGYDGNPRSTTMALGMRLSIGRHYDVNTASYTD